MKIAITGASGLVGSAVSKHLKQYGHNVVAFVRNQSNVKNGDIYWNPDLNEIDKQSLEGSQTLIHLAGENVGTGRWTGKKKNKIRESRLNGTKLLVETIKEMKNRPKTVIIASAIGYYGSREEEELTETSSKGAGFLANLCSEWEETAAPLKELGIRVVHLRIGMILSKKGGALKKMLLPFKLGLGGVIGSGKQYMSWIAIHDLVSIIDYVLNEEHLEGVFNAVSPEPVTNREFTKTLGAQLKRPTIFPLPAFIAKIVFGEMANELLLSSARVKPKKLLSEGFHFSSPSLEKALENIFDPNSTV